MRGGTLVCKTVFAQVPDSAAGSASSRMNFAEPLLMFHRLPWRSALRLRGVQRRRPTPTRPISLPSQLRRPRAYSGAGPEWSERPRCPALQLSGTVGADAVQRRPGPAPSVQTADLLALLRAGGGSLRRGVSAPSWGVQQPRCTANFRCLAAEGLIIRRTPSTISRWRCGREQKARNRCGIRPAPYANRPKRWMVAASAYCAPR